MPLDPDDQRTLDEIAEHGWSGKIIPGDAEGPGFEYTVGLLAGQKHPEVIIFGLPHRTGHDILWQMYDEIRAGRAFHAAGLYDDILVDCQCRIQIVHPTWHREFFGYALWHHRHAKISAQFAAVQCVWPDKRGLFPGERGCADDVAQSQPDLSKPKPEG